jgi:hypothetical protein
MREFDKLRAIVAREFLERVRTKWFVLFTVLGPVLLSAILFLPVWLASRDRAGVSQGPTIVLDGSGLGLGERVRLQLAAPRRASRRLSPDQLEVRCQSTCAWSHLARSHPPSRLRRARLLPSAPPGISSSPRGR